MMTKKYVYKHMSNVSKQIRFITLTRRYGLKKRELRKPTYNMKHEPLEHDTKNG